MSEYMSDEHVCPVRAVRCSGLRIMDPMLENPSKERDTGNAGIPCRNPALNSPPGRIESIWDQHKWHQFQGTSSATCATCVHIPVAPAADVSHVITNYEAVAGYFGHWLHRAQCPTLLTGEIGQIKLSHIRKKTWRGPGAGSKTEAAEPASLCGTF